MLSNAHKPAYYKGFIYSLLIHLVLIVFIVSHFNSKFTNTQLNAAQTVPIIQAHTVIESSVTEKVQQEVKQQAKEIPPPPIKTQAPKPPEVAFKSKIAPAPKKPEIKPEVKPVPQRLVKPVVKPEEKTKPTPKLTQEQRMQALAKKLQEQTRQNLQKQVQAEQKQLDQQLAQAQQTQAIVDKYQGLVRQQVEQNWVVTEINKNISCELLISLAPGGTVLDVKVVKSSGNAALDRSAIQAVYKSSPLPVPKESDAFEQFRNLDMTFKPTSAVSKIIKN